MTIKIERDLFGRLIATSDNPYPFKNQEERELEKMGFRRVPIDGYWVKEGD